MCKVNGCVCVCLVFEGVLIVFEWKFDISIDKKEQVECFFLYACFSVSFDEGDAEARTRIQVGKICKVLELIQIKLSAYKYLHFCNAQGTCA